MSVLEDLIVRVQCLELQVSALVKELHDRTEAQVPGHAAGDPLTARDRFLLTRITSLMIASLAESGLTQEQRQRIADVIERAWAFAAKDWAFMNGTEETAP